MKYRNVYKGRRQLFGRLVFTVYLMLPERIRDYLTYVAVRDVQKRIAEVLVKKRGHNLNSPLFRHLEITEGKKSFQGTGLLLGTFEQQIQESLTQMAPISTFIDVGAADGLWPVAAKKIGLAEHVIAYEAIEAQRDEIKLFAQQNRVEVEVRAELSKSNIDELIASCVGQNPVILMDVEGAETDILSPSFLDELTRLPKVTLIVELHPHLSGRAKDDKLRTLIEKKFKSVKYIDSGTRKISPEDSILLRDFPDWQVFIALSEQRQIWMDWAICRNFSE